MNAETQSPPDEPTHLDPLPRGRSPWWKRPGAWITTATLLAVIGAALLILRDLLVTRTWEGDMQFRVTSVSSEFVEVESIPGTAESPDGAGPQTEYVHDYIPMVPGSGSGSTVRCRVRQTYRANTNFDTGPQSAIADCALIANRTR